MMRQHGGLGESSEPVKLASYEVALKDKQQIAEGTYAFTFERPEEFEFKAGQHVRMSLINPSETDAEGDKRFLTMASTPQELDLRFAMRMRDTAFKRTLSRMQPGERVLIQKRLGASPHGSFILHDDAAQPAVFIVGGIGIVPAYSMIKDATERKLPHKLFLFYSNRRPEDAPFLAELQNFAKRNSNITLIATMTEAEKSTEVWRGETGQINQAMLKKYLSDMQTPVYYVAGLPEMASAMQTMLKNTGVSGDHIRAEEFTGFNLNELSNETSKGKKYLLPVVVAVALAAFLFMHLAASGAFSHAKLLGEFSFSNPLSYLVIVLILAVIAFKVAVFIKVKRKLHNKPGKLSVKDVVMAHKIGNDS